MIVKVRNLLGNKTDCKGVALYTSTIADMQQSDEWRPVLDGELSQAAQDAIQAIVKDLERLDWQILPVKHLCDYALFFAYLERMEKNGERLAEVNTCLDLIVDKVGDGNITLLGLYGGLGQVGWTIQHIRMLMMEESMSETEGDRDAAEDDPIESIDIAILRQLQKASWRGFYDVIGGLVGLGVYFLERLPKESARRGLTLILDHLEKSAIESWGGLTWHTPAEHLDHVQRSRYPTGYFNLGAAHGIPGILYLLGELLAQDIRSPQTTRLLDRAFTWLLARQRPPGARGRFSPWFVPGEPPQDSRLAWCYGDLGVAATSYQAAKRLHRPEFMEFATTLMTECASWPFEKTGIMDAPLCHGALGVAHVFNRFSQTCGDERYEEVAKNWYRHGLSLRQVEHGVGGFVAYRPAESPPFQADTSFLCGAVGVGLALMAAVNPLPPRWDRLLLLSGPDR